MDSVEKKYLYIPHHKVYNIYGVHYMLRLKKKNDGIDYIQ